MLNIYKNRSVPLDQKFVNVNLPIVIDGADVYDRLCPVNEYNGCRANPLELLQAISNDPVRSRLLSNVLQVLPTIASDSRLSDEDKINMMFDELQTGVPADDDLYRQKLEKVASALFRSLDISEQKSDKIDFKPADVPSVDSAPVAD